jgi:ATP-binding cassette, subfamily B, bacterial CvaB/MchF/RaxB
MGVLDGLNLGFSRQLPLQLQTEAAECGLACLAMVGSYHGYDTDIAHLRRRYSVSLKGMGLVQMIDVAARMDLSCRPLRAELFALGELALPAILHWDLNHFVVLKSVKGQHITIHDPAVGVRTLTLDEASKHFTGVAVELEPTLAFKKRTERQQLRLRDLMGRVRGLPAALGQVLVLALVLEVFALVTPLLTQWIVDDALVSGDKDLLTVIAIGLVLLGLMRAAVGLVRSWVLLHLGTTLNLQWVANVMAHLLKLPMAYFEKRHVGDVVSRFGSIATIQHTLTAGFVAALVDGLLAVTTLCVMFVYSPALGAIALGAVVLYGLLRVARYSALRIASEEQLVREARQQSNFIETVRGMQAIKLFNKQADRRMRYLKMAVDSTNAGITIQRLNIVFQTANTVIVALEGVLILWLGSKSVLDKSFTIGMLMAFISYKDQFTTRITSLIDKGIELRMLRLQAERLADIVLTEPEKEDPPQPGTAEHLQPSIELCNVRFRYADGEPWVLDGVNMHIAAGESVVLAGPSGCGKTTLLKIMLGQLEPVEGEVRIGGIALPRLGLARYRDMIGSVMQDDQLFAGSLADNICFQDNTPDQARIEACAQLAQIHADILRMPMGYHTLVGDMGTAHSGGQRQRVLLARALYKRPGILFLDEATSHLDVALEAQVSEAIAKMQLTRIVIAHRPETIASSGRVISLAPPRLPAR